jgi:hypothetical protein
LDGGIGAGFFQEEKRLHVAQPSPDYPQCILTDKDEFLGVWRKRAEGSVRAVSKAKTF